MQCTYCKNTFSNSKSLLYHQKTTSYCLKIQGKDTNVYECKGCNKNFSSKYSYERHIKSCKILFKEENEKEFAKRLKKALKEQSKKLKKEYKKEMKERESELKRVHKRELNELKKEHKKEMKEVKEEYEKELYKLNKKLEEKDKSIENLAAMAIQKPTSTTNTTNNTVNNVLMNITPLDLDREDFKSKIQSGYTKEYFARGIRGIADFSKEVLLVDEEGNSRYICSDPSRGVFKYKDSNGVIHRDVKANKLSKKITPDILTKAKEIVKQENEENAAEQVNGAYQRMYYEICEMRENPDKVGNELCKIVCV